MAGSDFNLTMPANVTADVQRHGFMEPSYEAWWVFVFFTGAGVLALFYRFARIMRRGAAPKSTRRAYSVAFSSACIYLGIALLGLTPIVRHAPHNFKVQYKWLPFWYSFLLCKFVGEFVDAAWHSVLGTLTGVGAMVLLNYLMPGGATPDFEKGYEVYPWIPGGYSNMGCLIYSAIFVYGVFVSKTTVSFKQYALGFYSSCIVQFMDPSVAAQQFEAVVIYYDWSVNWTGQVLCTVYAVFLAVPFAALSLPVVPCLKSSRKFYSCHAQSVTGISNLLVDSMAALERIATFFRDDTRTFDVDSTYLFVRSLGKRRTEVEQLLDQAEWECFSSASRAQLRDMRKVVEFLRSFRQALRIQLQYVKQHRGQLQKKQLRSVEPLLNEFLRSFGDAVNQLACKDVLRQRLDDSLLDDLHKAAHTADASLVSALQQLDADPSEKLMIERAFIDGLRSLPTFIGGCVDSQKGCAEAEDGSQSGEDARTIQSKRFSRCCPLGFPRRLSQLSSEAHTDATRNAISWFVALLWSLFRDYDSTCVTAISFLFSPSLGSLFDRNINRMVGVGLGLVLGNVPAMLLKTQITIRTNTYHLDRTLHVFRARPQAIYIYLAMMMVLWGVSIFGYLAKRTDVGTNWSYACLLWAGFGGVQMLKQGTVQWGQQDGMLFESIMDNFMGCMIAFVVDLAFARYFASRVTDHVANFVPRCFDSIASIVYALHEGNFDLDSELQALSGHIAQARYWDGEVRKMDLVWNSLHSEPYKMELVQALLDHCDDAYVAIWSILASSQRIEHDQLAMRLLHTALPELLGKLCKRYSDIVHVALDEKTTADRSAYEKPQKGKFLEGAYTVATVRLRSLICAAAEDSSEDSDGPVEDASPMLVLEHARLSSGSFEEPQTRARTAVSRAAAAAVSGCAQALRLSLLQVGVLLEEHRYWQVSDLSFTSDLLELRKSAVEDTSSSSSSSPRV